MSSTCDVPEYERSVCIPEKQNFVYPEEPLDIDQDNVTLDDVKLKDLDVYDEIKDNLWKKPQITRLVIEMFCEFLHLYIQLTPLQQKIATELILDPGISFGDLCKKVGYNSSWIHLNCKRMIENPEFLAIMPGNLMKKWK